MHTLVLVNFSGLFFNFVYNFFEILDYIFTTSKVFQSSPKVNKFYEFFIYPFVIYIYITIHIINTIKSFNMKLKIYISKFFL